MQNPTSIASDRPDSIADLDLSIVELFSWLSEMGLTRSGTGYNVEVSQELLIPESPAVLGLPCCRTQKKAKSELDRIKETYAKEFSRELSAPSDWEKIWSEVRNPLHAIRQLDLKRIPADAIAFYRPFHFPPLEEWGIYIHIPRLMKYGKTLETSLGRLKSFTPETLTLAILFDVFHHEFFHHLVESTATILEVVCAATGDPRSIYLDYWHHSYEQEQGIHPHKPIEEALANAYAYNSFSFISRVKVGYKNRFVKLYQAALEKCWLLEPPGYKEAQHYIKGGQIAGATDLLNMFLRTDKTRSKLPLGALAQFVFPSGHTALCNKPEIPTYLMGTADELNAFHSLVPAPNEGYTNLFWPGDTKGLDDFIKEKQKEEQEAKKRGPQMRIRFQ